ncbi:YifB family Mg chelatase-like AAA ATPase [Metabacillus halosaccharovorans]|uniref:YifB family Mg chelatase-like AAA ATPase n=1 Tax=Metabacillus halosaccharovorans TaxID=930124 RepID=UPI00203BEC91|nr:YifB family Mg chelatase-like AAA ATPase [Metabacillus halosaccharovorans]MCM3443117.1 YifB family Mg chelatase-like AAA ATPase [Metabacillus halosaccharovorans]
MTVKVTSIGLKGLEGYCVQVEVRISTDTESMVIVGLPDTSVKESRDSIAYFDQDVTDKKVVVNLSPSDQKKNGSLFDLAIAIAMLKELGEVKNEIPKDTAFIGALSLDGSVVSGDGILPAVIAAKGLGMKSVYVPYDPLLPLQMLEDIECIVVQHIEEVVQHLEGQELLSFQPQSPSIEDSPKKDSQQRDFSHVIGHERAKRALEIAASGEHNLLMSGPPGCGKSLLAETFPSILPPLSNQSQLEVISLYQLASEKRNYDQTVPFRHPHHSSSAVAIIGGGSNPRPGEISLAHRGVLFLDEIAEFSKKTLDMLRQPLETGEVTISRVHSTVTYPSSFILVGAMNPCPCGYLGSHQHYCTCTKKQILSYRNRLSGPIYDRFDILLSIKSVNINQPKRMLESSEEIRKRVETARIRQYYRYQQEISNAKVPFEILMEKSPLTTKQSHTLTNVSAKQNWSNRVQIKIIRLARTISDIAGEEKVTDQAIWEAMTFRRWEQNQPKMMARET